MDKCFDTRDGCRGKLAVGIRSGRTRRSNFHDLMVHHRIIFPRQNGGARTLRVETMSLCLRCQLRDKRGLLTAGRPRAPIAGANGGVTSLGPGLVDLGSSGNAQGRPKVGTCQQAPDARIRLRAPHSCIEPQRKPTQTTQHLCKGGEKKYRSK